MATVDTNILLRWLLDDVPQQTQAADALVTGRSRFLVPDVVFIEVVYVLERVMRLPRATIAQSIEAIFALPGADFDRVLWQGVLGVYETHPELSISDVFLAEQARSRGTLPLYTFDHKLANQLEGAELLPVVD